MLWQKTEKKLEWSSSTVAGAAAGMNGSRAEMRNLCMPEVQITTMGQA